MFTVPFGHENVCVRSRPIVTKCVFLFCPSLKLTVLCACCPRSIHFTPACWPVPSRIASFDGVEKDGPLSCFLQHPPPLRQWLSTNMVRWYPKPISGFRIPGLSRTRRNAYGTPHNRRATTRTWRRWKTEKSGVHRGAGLDAKPGHGRGVDDGGGDGGGRRGSTAVVVPHFFHFLPLFTIAHKYKYCARVIRYLACFSLSVYLGCWR